MQRFSVEILGLIAGIAIFISLLLAALVYIPGSPLPDHWNPTKPLDVRAEFTPVARWKLAQHEDNFAYCRKYLDALDVKYTVLDDRVETPNCHIRNQVQIAKLSTADINPLRTRCATALRLALWEFHVVQPVANEILNSKIGSIRHQGSYSCRKIRTETGPSDRFSQHATASAIDIEKMETRAGQQISLSDNWNDTNAFLKAIRDGGCRIFPTVLSPDFNSLHTDHFHFDLGLWRTCR